MTREQVIQLASVGTGRQLFGCKEFTFNEEELEQFANLLIQEGVKSKVEAQYNLANRAFTYGLISHPVRIELHVLADKLNKEDNPNSGDFDD